jgi:tetratricopeptide (TPR) repeat protein
MTLPRDWKISSDILDGKELFNKEKYEESLTVFERLIKNAKKWSIDMAECYFYRGKCFFKIGEKISDRKKDEYLDKSIKDFIIFIENLQFTKKAIVIDILETYDNQHINNNLNEIFNICKQLLYSERCENVKVYVRYCLGLYYYNIKNYEESIKIFEEYICKYVNTIKPISDLELLKVPFDITEKIYFYTTLSNIFLEQYRQAITISLDYISKFKANRPETQISPKILYNVGFCYEEIEEYQHALQYYELSLANLNSNFELKKEFIDKFEYKIQNILDKKTVRFDCLMKIGIIYRKLRENKLAKDYFMKIINELENDESLKRQYLNNYYTAKNNLASLYTNIGELEKAANQMKFLENGNLKEKEKKAAWIDTMGYIQYKRGEYDKAIDYFDEALKYEDTKKDIIWFHKGNCFLLQGKYDKAIKSYDNALDFNKNNIETYNNKAVALHHNSNDSKAINELKTALKINPSFMPAHFNLMKLTLS